MTENEPETPTERLNHLEERMGKLEVRMKRLRKRVGTFEEEILNRIDKIETVLQETNRLLRKLAGEPEPKPD